MSPNNLIHSSNEADKPAHDFAASIASAYWLSTRKTTILDSKYEIPALDRLFENNGTLNNYGKKPGIQHAKGL
jgi:hypothetical protein